MGRQWIFPTAIAAAFCLSVGAGRAADWPQLQNGPARLGLLAGEDRRAAETGLGGRTVARAAVPADPARDRRRPRAAGHGDGQLPRLRGDHRQEAVVLPGGRTHPAHGGRRRREGLLRLPRRLRLRPRCERRQPGLEVRERPAHRLLDRGAPGRRKGLHRQSRRRLLCARTRRRQGGLAARPGRADPHVVGLRRRQAVLRRDGHARLRPGREDAAKSPGRARRSTAPPSRITGPWCTRTMCSSGRRRSPGRTRGRPSSGSTGRCRSPSWPSRRRCSRPSRRIPSRRTSSCSTRRPAGRPLSCRTGSPAP